MPSIVSTLKADWLKRPWWMNLIYYFCVYMSFIYMPFDIFFKPVSSDHEIWFGFALVGWWAKLTAPLHWIIYGMLAYGFWRMKSWMWPWAAVYAAQVVIAMVVWNMINTNGRGLVAGVIAGILFALPMIALWRSRQLFDTQQVTE